MANLEDETKLERFLQWLQVNKVELRGCKIKYCHSNKGFGIFSASGTSDGVLLVVPLDLAITPMRVLQDPLLGPECRAMFEEGEVDDRFLMILFLTVERLRKSSSWKPYLDMLPLTFGNPLCFTDDELLELKGTTLYRATKLQVVKAGMELAEAACLKAKMKKRLQSLYDNQVKGLVKKLLTLEGDSESEVSFEDFLWANSIFWTRALNIPLPHSYVFPKTQERDSNFPVSKDSEDSTKYSGDLFIGKDEKGCRVQDVSSQINGVTSASIQGETIWVEGLVPGIDFCNHDLKAAATWEVDGTGSITGVPFSMYLLSAQQSPFAIEREISISYGNKGNEELLYLYGFVIDNNPDDYLMVHYPMEAIQNVPFSDSKVQLLEAQKAELRCLLPRTLLDHGFFSESTEKSERTDKWEGRVCNYSWSGQRKLPSYLNKLVFPESFLTGLRTIALVEEQIFLVSSMLEELVGPEGERQPSDTEVRAAVWEACGDSGALQLLVDLLQTKKEKAKKSTSPPTLPNTMISVNARMMDLEENSGTEECDTELLKGVHTTECQEQQIIYKESLSQEIDGQMQQKLSRNRFSSIVYRRGQKQLTRLFLKEAEHALQLALREGN